MPQLTLEYTSNIIEQHQWTELFTPCHQILANTLPTQLASCKSRAYVCNTYHIGDGNSNNAFVHLNVKVLPGRSEEILQSCSAQLLEQLKKHFAASAEKLQLQISVDVSNSSSTYLKSIS